MSLNNGDIGNLRYVKCKQFFKYSEIKQQSKLSEPKQYTDKVRAKTHP